MSKLSVLLSILALSLALLTSCTSPAAANPLSDDGFVTIHRRTDTGHCNTQGNWCRHSVITVENKPSMTRTSGKKIDTLLLEPTKVIILGEIIDPHSDFFEARYGRAINKFPHLASCLTDPEKSRSDNMSVININWGLFENRYDIEVCMMAVAQMLRTPAKIKQWLAANDMIVTSFPILSPKDGLRIHAGINRVKYPLDNPENTLWNSVRRSMAKFDFFQNYAGIFFTYKNNNELFEVSLDIGGK
jgi:hypothetical protein